MVEPEITKPKINITTTTNSYSVEDQIVLAGSRSERQEVTALDRDNNRIVNGLATVVYPEYTTVPANVVRKESVTKTIDANSGKEIKPDSVKKAHGSEPDLTKRG